jgi:hypothetical protein
LEVLAHRTIVCPLGGDLVEGGAKLGERTTANDEACAEEVTRLLKSGKMPRVILSAGHAKIHGKSSKFPGQRYTMAMMMKDHLVSLGVSSRLIRFSRETWGTKGELKAVQNEIRAAESIGEIIDEVVLITTWWHVPRTKRNAKRIISRPVRIIGTEHDARSIVLIEEGVKFFAEEVRSNVPGVGTFLRWGRGRD